MLASTHGVQVYHPNPDDYWRWTHAGLVKLFGDNGEWRSMSVSAGSGTAACVGMLLNIYADLALRRARLRPLSRAFCTVVNRTAGALDARSSRLGEPGPGSLHANYHVVAEAPR